jgi:hypothetical protein
MEKRLAKRKSLRRKFKRYAAAVLGTAIMTGAALPGMPAFSQALASEAPTSPPIQNEQTTTIDKNIDKNDRHDNKTKLNRNGWHEHKYGWPSSGDNKAWYENGRIYYMNDNDRYNDRHHDGYAHYLNSPITFVRQYATNYGFDADRDSFTIIHESYRKATVQVINNNTGQRFKIDLEREDGSWKILTIRGIGDSRFPATYYSVARS